MPGVDPYFIVHKLNVDPLYPPKKIKVGWAIEEVFFLDWLANMVVVKKKNSKWRVCIDFMDWNKACPKDPFPVPKIDQLVEATYGHLRMSFLDITKLL